MVFRIIWVFYSLVLEEVVLQDIVGPILLEQTRENLLKAFPQLWKFFLLPHAITLAWLLDLNPKY